MGLSHVLEHHNTVIKMKTRSLIALLMIALTAVLATSCYSSRKNGCPGNPQANYRFRG